MFNVPFDLESFTQEDVIVHKTYNGKTASIGDFAVDNIY